MEKEDAVFMQALSEVTKNPHFYRFVTIIQVASTSWWRRLHPEVPSVRGSLLQLSRWLSARLTLDRVDLGDFTEQWEKILVNIRHADPRLSWRIEDMDWFMRVLTLKDGGLFFKWLLLYGGSSMEYLSLEEVSKATGRSIEEWRRIAESGSILGARERNGSWQLPLSGLRAYGIVLPEHITKRTLEEQIDALEA